MTKRAWEVRPIPSSSFLHIGPRVRSRVWIPAAINGVDPVFDAVVRIVEDHATERRNSVVVVRLAIRATVPIATVTTATR
jgi:hypothetical protein